MENVKPKFGITNLSLMSRMTDGPVEDIGKTEPVYKTVDVPARNQPKPKHTARMKRRAKAKAARKARKTNRK